MIIAVIGSGGKTSLIRALAAQYRSQGKTVFVTTTTHMFVEPDTILTEEPGIILERLEKTGYAMAGVPVRGKIGQLPEATYNAVCARADVVLVEADGSRHKALKFPNATEPVIPENTDRIILVWGSHGLGKPAREACHRLELVMQCLDIREDTVITMDHVRKLLLEGYVKPLKQRYPHIPLEICPPL